MYVAMNEKFEIYCIVWNQETLDFATTKKYKFLNNINSPRSDWYESWPIWNFLNNNNLNDDTFYGFLSPKFESKTGLTHEGAVRFSVSRATQDTEIITFSPQPDQAAVFLNVFEHANFYFPGYINLVDKFLNIAELSNLSIHDIMDTRNIVFSNYYFAKPKFWNAWKSLFELLFKESENEASTIYDQLNMHTNYPGSVQRKVFLAEQLASIILVTNNFKVLNYNTWFTSKSSTPFSLHMDDMVILDALKIAAKETGLPQYINAFGVVRDTLLDKIRRGIVK